MVLWSDGVNGFSSRNRLIFLLDTILAEVLDLASNNLQGSIPMSIGEMTRLRKSCRVEVASALFAIVCCCSPDSFSVDTIILSGNQLDGNIPATIGQLTNLGKL